jgi:hypothetical protein
MKTGSGIRAVNMRAAKKAKDESPDSDTNHLASLPSFSDSIDFTLDIIYFLSILSAVALSELVRSSLLLLTFSMILLDQI